MTSCADRWVVNKSGAAAWFGVTLTTINRWLLQGAPAVRRGRQGEEWVLDLRELVRWRYTPDEPAAEPFDPERATPKDRKDWFDSEHRRRQLEDRDQQLVPAAEVEAGMAALACTIRDVLGTVPDRLREIGLDERAIAVAKRHLREVS